MEPDINFSQEMLVKLPKLYLWVCSKILAIANNIHGLPTARGSKIYETFYQWW